MSMAVCEKFLNELSPESFAAFVKEYCSFAGFPHIYYGTVSEFCATVTIYNSIYDSEAKLFALVSLVQTAGSLGQLAELRTKLIHMFTDSFNSNGNFDINSPNLEKFHNLAKNKSANVYNYKNLNHIFVSVDLEKANFQALRQLNLTFGTSTYGDFLRVLYSKLNLPVALPNDFFDVLACDKSLRSALFGYPERYVKGFKNKVSNVEKCLIYSVYERLISAGVFTADMLVSANHDELVFDITSVSSSFDVNALQRFVLDETSGVKVHTDIFRLTYFSEFKVQKHTFYAHEGLGCYLCENLYPKSPYKKYKFKGGNCSIYHLLMYKLLYGMPVTDKDITFTYPDEAKKAVRLVECPHFVNFTSEVMPIKDSTVLYG